MMVFMVRVPTHYNDGSEIPASVIGGIFDDAYSKFTGCTFGPVEDGAWVSSDGQVYIEPSRPLQIAMDRSRLEEARQFAIEIGRLLKQEAMYTEVRYADGVEIIPVT